MKTAELLFVPSPGAGHLYAMVELANQLVNRDHRLSVTVCLMKKPYESPSPGSTAQSFTHHSAKPGRIRFVDLPAVESDPDPNATPGQLLLSHIEAHKIHIREIASNYSPTTSTLAGFVLDMFCTSIVDVADEFGLPSYVFYTCGATFLGFMLHLQDLYDRRLIDPIAIRDSDTELAIPGLANPLPGKNLPSDAVEEEWLKVLVETTRRIREAKGIMVNTYLELESSAVDSLSKGETPPVYPIGPILNLKGGNSDEEREEIIGWLDDQPPSSVVFLCFGSLGIFCDEQLKEIAIALERSGERFLWSIRRSNDGGLFDDGGFMERTAGRGKVIGWAPQTEILGHRAVRGFVSHCGWNSTLESIWFGVPMAAWPIYAEQQLNAFKLVKELELAEEIRIDYRRDGGVIVTAEEIEGGIRRLMAAADGMRKKVKEMSHKGREALIEGGSSYSSMGRLIEDLMGDKIQS